MLSGLRVYGFCFTVGTLLPASASALTQQQVHWCNSGTSVSPDLRIKSCTNVILSGRALGKNLAAAFVNRGNAYGDKGDYGHAIADYNEAIRLNPRYTSAYFNRGVTYFHKGDYDRAIADCNEAISLNPRYTFAYNNRGNAYGAKGDYGHAIVDYNEAIGLNPRYAAPYNGRGAAYFHKGDYDHAIADYSEAIRLNPGYASAYFNRGRVNLDVGAVPKALADLTQAGALDPKDAYIALWRDIASKRSGLAGQLAVTSKQIDMTRWPAPLVRLYLDQLTPAATIAAADDPDPATKNSHVCEAKFFIGEFDLWQGKKDEAARLFRAVVAGCPGSFGDYDDAAAEVKTLGAQP